MAVGGVRVEPLGVLYFFIRLLVLLVMSHLIDLLLARSLSRFWYRAFRWFGVAVHELSHALVCVLAGAKISEINLFDQGGGYVRHEKKGPLATAFISMAPAFGGPVTVVLLAVLFRFMGVFYPLTYPSITTPAAMVYTIPAGIWDVFYNNLAPLDPVTILLFILLMWLVGSIVSTLAPSSVDLRNGGLGVAILGAVAGLVAWFKPLSMVPGVTDRFGTATPAMDFASTWMGAGLDIGLFAVVVVLVFAVPLYLVKGR